VTTASGKAMPIDPEPMPHGNVELVTEDVGTIAVVHAQPDAGPSASVRYVSHFFTCPDGPSWRRK
jgi:hypothetical protein